jgi:hypothetical protein
MKQLVVGSFMLVLVALGWGAPSIGQEMPAPQGELRVVDKDPRNWTSIVFNVFEHLIELDPEGRPVPRLATGWRWLDERTDETSVTAAHWSVRQHKTAVPE